MAAPKKPTKQQIEQGKARAGGNNPIKVTDKGLKKLGSVVATAATVLPAGRAAKAATTVAKAAVKARSAAKANTRALKAANKDVAIKYKNGKNPDNFSGRNESKPKQVAKNKTRANNPNAKMTRPSSYKDSMAAERIRNFPNRKKPQYEVEIQGKIYKGAEAERKMESLRKLQGGK